MLNSLLPKPTYEQLEETIRRKDKAVEDAYWDAQALWAIAWLARHAEDSGHVDFDNERYREAASCVLGLIAKRALDTHQKLVEEHDVLRDIVTAGAT